MSRLLIFMALASFGIVRELSAQQSTMQQIDSLVKTGVEATMSQTMLHTVANDTATCFFHEHPLATLLREHAVDYLQSNKFVLRETSQDAATFAFSFKEVAVRYREGDDDSVVREVAVSLRAVERNTDGVLRATPIYSGQTTAKIHRNSIAKVEAETPSFLYPEIPPKNSTVWHDVLEPLAAVGAAALAVFILFSARSQ